jgi:hypothetical protein
MSTNIGAHARLFAACTLILLVAVSAKPAFAAKLLDDEQLDVVTAGAESSALEEIVVHATRLTAGGRKVTAEGTIGVQNAAGAPSAADLVLRDSAQSNLQALINVNAVNSVVNVLLNLNITIDSNVGEIRQLNLTNP